MSNSTIVFHENCHDGATAAVVARYSLGEAGSDADMYPGRYDVPPDLQRLSGRDVIIVDFSWKRAPLLEVEKVAKSIRLLDHHKSAEADLHGLSWATFDMTRSGAGLAWDYLVGGERPILVDYVEDRDLWRFRLPQSKEVHAACNSYPLDLTTREYLVFHRPVQELMDEGVAILRYHDKLVDSAAKHARLGAIAGTIIPVIACPTIEIVSDLGHRLAQGQPFAACYVDRADGTRLYSLRSADGGMDVSEVAKLFQGGGHRNAAGFTLDAETAAEWKRSGVAGL